MKQIRFLTLMVAFGSLILCACSSDDSTNIESENIAVLRPLDAAASQLNQRLEGLDFKELDPLAETIASNTRADGEASEFDDSILYFDRHRACYRREQATKWRRVKSIAL